MQATPPTRTVQKVEPMNLNQVTLPSTDVARSIAFYRRLGFELIVASAMLQITDQVALPISEVELSAIRAQGPGGQNVNKVSCAVHLRFDIAASSLPDALKALLLTKNDQRLSKHGVLVLKAQQSRSLEQNKDDALRRLQQIL